MMMNRFTWCAPGDVYAGGAAERDAIVRDTGSRATSGALPIFAPPTGSRGAGLGGSPDRAARSPPESIGIIRRCGCWSGTTR